MSEFHLYDCGGEVVSATSPEDAAEVYRKGTGETVQDTIGDPEATWDLVPDDKAIATIDEDTKGQRVTKTAAEWAKEIGRGMAWSHNE